MNESSKKWIVDYPLHACCEMNDIESLERSPSQYISLINTPDNENWYPLHYCAFTGHHKVLQWLIANGADLKVKNQSKATPLHIAIGSGQLECVKSLLEAINSLEILLSKNDEYLTPVQLASYVDDISLQKELIKLFNDKKLQIASQQQ